MKLLKVLEFINTKKNEINKIAIVSTILVLFICVYDVFFGKIDTTTYVLMGCFVYNTVTLLFANFITKGIK